MGGVTGGLGGGRGVLESWSGTEVWAAREEWDS